MKKGTILLLVIFLTTFSAKSYTLSADEPQAMDGKPSMCSLMTYSLEVGLTVFNQMHKYDGEANNDDYHSRVGFHVAATAIYTLSAAFFIMTMLDFTLKGTQYKYSYSGYSGKDKLSVFYLQLPILLAYNFAVIQAYTFSAMFGPYFSAGLFGKYKYENTYDGNTESGSDKLKFGKDNNLRGADFGLIFGLMVLRDIYTFRVAYQMGLKNIYPVVDSPYGLFNRGFNITFGIRF